MCSESDKLHPFLAVMLSEVKHLTTVGDADAVHGERHQFVPLDCNGAAIRVRLFATLRVTFT